MINRGTQAILEAIVVTDGKVPTVGWSNKICKIWWLDLEDWGESKVIAASQISDLADKKVGESCWNWIKFNSF